MTIEICVADADGARAAAEGGADRVELCSALEIGGVTPSWGLLQRALASAPGLAITVLIRPRGGGFVFSPGEVDVMVADVAHLVGLTASEAGRVGFTVGALTPDGGLDVPTLGRLVEAADGRRLCFHKGFDSLPSPADGLAALGELGFSGVLTSGGHGPASEHHGELARLVDAAPPGVRVIAAGGVRASSGFPPVSGLAECTRRTKNGVAEWGRGPGPTRLSRGASCVFSESDPSITIPVFGVTSTPTQNERYNARVAPAMVSLT